MRYLEFRIHRSSGQSSRTGSVYRNSRLQSYLQNGDIGTP